VPANTSMLLKEESDHFHEITKEDWFTLTPKKPHGPRRHRKNPEHRNVPPPTSE